MQIRDVKCYLLQGEPATRQESCGARGSIAPVPPGISGLLTHDQGFGAVDPEGFTFTGEEPEPTYRLMIRLVTDGELDAYANYATGYNPRELEWEAKAFLARYAHMLIGVDAFDREYIWQRFWMAQRFMYTGRGCSTPSTGCCGIWRVEVLACRSTSCSEPAAKVFLRTATSVGGPLTTWWPTR